MSTNMTQRERQLLEQRATAWSQVQDIQARRSAAGYQPSDEDGTSYTRALDDVERLSREIEEEQRAARLATSMGGTIDPSQRSTNPRPGEDGDVQPDVSEQYRTAFAQYLRSGEGRLTADQQRSLEQGFVSLENETRALGTTTDAAGGYTVPKEFLQRMVESVVSFGGIVGLAETMNTDSGAPLQWPTNDDTANKGAILAENTQVTEQDLVFNTGSLGAHMYTSKMVRVPRQLLQDSAFNLDAWLPSKLGTRIGRAAAEHFAVGTGTGQPQGLVTGLTKGVTTAAAGKITWKDLIALEFAIDVAYRNRGQYVIADTALRGFMTAEDSTGRPLWQPAVVGGAPSTINGRPYTVDNGLAAVATTSKSVVFGDIRTAYVVRFVNGAQTLRLSERYADYLQIGFLGFQRIDARVQDTGAAAVLTTL